MAKDRIMQLHTIAQKLYFSDAKDPGEIRTMSPLTEVPNADTVG